MAQLTDDCFAFSGPLLPLEEMERLIETRVQPVPGKETVLLRAAGGRILAADIAAPLDLPPFDNSAVDGYAVRHRDLKPDAETRLTVSGRVMAGHRSPNTVGAGEAVRIFTGAPMPAGADTVFMQEDVRTEGEAVIVPPGLKSGVNRRLAGEIFPSAIECGGSADFEIGDPGIGGVKTTAFLLVACDRQRQCALGTFDGCRRIAHLLVENEKRRAVFQFFPSGSHAAPEKRQNSFEHW